MDWSLARISIASHENSDPHFVPQWRSFKRERYTARRWLLEALRRSWMGPLAPLHPATHWVLRRCDAVQPSLARAVALAIGRSPQHVSNGMHQLALRLLRDESIRPEGVTVGALRVFTDRSRRHHRWRGRGRAAALPPRVRGERVLPHASAGGGEWRPARLCRPLFGQRAAAHHRRRCRQ